MKLAKFLLLVSILLLAACQSATPAPTSQPAFPTQEPQPGVESYPAPPLNQGQAYPAPQTQAPSGESGYPVPRVDEAAVITWQEARDLILEGRVSQVTQLHDLTVTLDLKDGSTVKTTEPAIDEVFKVIDQCGDPCSDIIRATE
ncbi:MAG TPA: hypothetical protein VE136_10815 [Anaerolineales bacterium]|nr:hypothetical protein [Anaerolineales bacterium]